MTVPVTALPAEVGGAVTRVFGDRVALAERYVQHLASTGVERGLVGPREVDRLWTRHVLNCAAFEALVPRGAVCADVGSGAGLPGLVLGIARPDVSVTLVEPLLRRVTWLREVLEDLGLDNVTVERTRAEQWGERPLVEVCTARAVAELTRLAGWCMPLVRPGGSLLALKGRSAAEELEASGGALAELGVASTEVINCEVPGVPEADAIVLRAVRSNRALGSPRRRERSRRRRPA